MKKLPHSQELRQQILLLIVMISSQVPFLTQAFHMDDPIYLLLAKQVLKNPWFPQDMPIMFEGVYAEDLASMEHPPLIAYVMAVVALVFGFSEFGLHLAYLVFPAIAALSMYSLSRRFTQHPLICTAVLLALPVVYVMSHNLMTDLPLLALWIASAATFVSGVDNGSKLRICWSAIITILATMVSYAGLCLIPLLALYGLLKKKPYGVYVICTAPVLALLLWLAMNYHHYGRVIPGYMLEYYFGTARILWPGSLWNKLVYMITAVGGISLFSLAAFLFSQRHWKRSLVLGLLVALILINVTAISSYALDQKILFILCFMAGFGTTLEIAHIHLRCLRSLLPGVVINSDELFLTTWFFGFFVFCVAFYMTGSARYLLPLTPPLILSVVRRAEIKLREPNFKRLALCSLILSSSLAVLCAISDYQFASMYREFATRLHDTYGSRPGQLWFTGEWGLRAYLEKLGGRELGRRDTQPRKGDLLVVPTLATPYQTLFSEIVSVPSVVMVAPARLSFDVPAIKERTSLVLTMGLPFWRRSDGMELTIRLASGDRNHVLYSTFLSPEGWRRWRNIEIPLNKADASGTLVFETDVGRSGHADADWLAIARARICSHTNEGELVLYDFYNRLSDARIEPSPGIKYHTPGNTPAFPLNVWLEQEPARRLLETRQYSPAIPVRLLDSDSHAGFWSMGWGLLPFSIRFRERPLEEISIYEVTRQVEGFGESPPTWYRHSSSAGGSLTGDK